MGLVLYLAPSGIVFADERWGDEEGWPDTVGSGHFQVHTCALGHFLQYPKPQRSRKGEILVTSDLQPVQYHITPA